jgi:hypothetical protein
MINVQQRIVLKKLLKGDYINDVQARLAEKKIVSKNNTPYSDKMISHVFNGRYENKAIEVAILEVYQERKDTRDLYEKWKDDVLGIAPSDEKADD